MTDKLTNKQQRFVEEYLIDLNATQASIRSGYSEKTAKEIGCENLTKPNIADAVAKAQAKRSKRTEITQDAVLAIIQETVDRCRQVKPVLDRTGKQITVETEDGEMVPAFTFDASNVLKGSELLGKHLKMFTDKHDLNHTGGFSVTIADKDADCC